MSTWLFDLGNTRLKCAPLGDDGQPGAVQGAAHATQAQGVDWCDVLPARLDTAVVASVAAPVVRMQLLDALTARGAQVRLAHTLSMLDGVRIAYAEPARLGVDRFLALLAAHAEGGAALVVGVGTALTLDLLDAGGHHLGGRIAPSPTLMREALHQRVAQLAPTGGRYVDFAADTDDALASGCEGAAVALVERGLADAHVRLGEAPRLLLHGGGGPALRAWLPQAHWRPDLVLHGLARWHFATGAASAASG